MLNKYNLFIAVCSKTFAAVWLLSVFYSCGRKTQSHVVVPAFYYWKSVLSLNQFEQQQMNALHVQTLYIKCFDVDWDDITHQPVPKAKLQCNNFSLPDSLHIIPTVFITNECILKVDSGSVPQLANKIHQLVQDMITAYHFNNIDEFQLDCDWTPSTKEKYFLLLRTIYHQPFSVKDKTVTPTLSSTIRLHQIKYITKTGVPPVNKGLLMCYNMGNLKDPAAENSILDVSELKKYIGNLQTYPLPLDVGLPVFDWKVLFRNNAYNGLIENLPDSLLTNPFVAQQHNRFTFLKDTVLQGYSFLKGDVLRNEQCDAKTVIEAAALITQQLKNTRLMVSLYHLDSVILKKYSLHELEAMYNSLR
ncbi:MAG: hypothetical protein JST86_07385 [Bacteroidetes bacterium]|nr:hypothetical protein [Bacteroidota bacterium]